jgi:hypothetical protein
MLAGWQLVCCEALLEKWLTRRCCWSLRYVGLSGVQNGVLIVMLRLAVGVLRSFTGEAADTPLLLVPQVRGSGLRGAQ